ncbi:2-hydroxyacid dehydrogenase [soil metagenome]
MATTVLFPASLLTDGRAPASLTELPDVELVIYDDPSRWPDGAEHAQVLVVGWGDPAPIHPGLGALVGLRLIQVIGAGVEQWEGQVPDGVLLSNARGAHGGATAEWAIAALLAVVREFPRFVLEQANGEWAPGLTATLVGARVLVVGAGDLAAELQRRLSGFDAEVTLVGRTARTSVRPVSELLGLLPAQDAVVVTVPQTPDTVGMVDADFLAHMADGAILVNAARGPIVRTAALLAELTSGRLRAALDVTDPEPLPPGHPLWEAPGLLLTPHVAGNTEGATERGLVVIAEQIRQFIAGGTPANVQSVDGVG